MYTCTWVETAICNAVKLPNQFIAVKYLFKTSFAPDVRLALYDLHSGAEGGGNASVSWVLTAVKQQQEENIIET